MYIKSLKKNYVFQKDYIVIKAKPYSQLLMFIAVINILLGAGVILTTFIKAIFSSSEYPILISILYNVNNIAFFSLSILFGLRIIKEKNNAWKYGILFYLTVVLTNIGELIISLVLTFVFKGGLTAIFTFLTARNIVLLSIGLFVLNMLKNESSLKEKLKELTSPLYLIPSLITLIFLSRFYFVIVHIKESMSNHF